MTDTGALLVLLAVSAVTGGIIGLLLAPISPALAVAVSIANGFLWGFYLPPKLTKQPPRK